MNVQRKCIVVNGESEQLVQNYEERPERRGHEGLGFAVGCRGPSLLRLQQHLSFSLLLMLCLQSVMAVSDAKWIFHLSGIVR